MGTDGKRAIRVMLADDHETVRQGLRALFRSVPDVDIVHDVGDGESALEAMRNVAPDLLIVDLAMPRCNGLNLMRRLKHARRQAKVVVLTRFREEGYVREALAAGASGYVLKQSSFTHLRSAVEAAASGGQYLDPALWRLVGVSAVEPSPDSTPPTDRERAVLQRSARGETNKDIAGALGIAVKTVEVHKSNAMRKLGLTHRTQLVRYAVLHGWFADL